MMNKADTTPSRLMLVGVGDLTKRLVHLLIAQRYPGVICLAARDLDTAVRHANLANYSALNMGIVTRVEAVTLDLQDEASAANVLSDLQPGFIFMGASLQAARKILDLPAELTQAIDQAQLGPWLPAHLSLNLHLRAAMRAAGVEAHVVNAAYPDAVGPVMAGAGQAPLVGIGNVANIVPALTFAVADQLDRAVDEVDVKLVAHHYVSHRVHRFGNSGGAPYHLSAYDTDSGEELPFDHTSVFEALTGPLRRQGGMEGQHLTASSAAKLLTALTQALPVAMHAPAPHGLPGGYPVRVSSAGVELDLPPDLTLEQAVAINLGGQLADGIESISEEGVVRYASEQMDIMERLTGYRCTEMPYEAAHEQAHLLMQACAALGDRHACSA